MHWFEKWGVGNEELPFSGVLFGHTMDLGYYPAFGFCHFLLRDHVYERYLRSLPRRCLEYGLALYRGPSILRLANGPAGLVEILRVSLEGGSGGWIWDHL